MHNFSSAIQQRIFLTGPENKDKFEVFHLRYSLDFLAFLFPFSSINSPTVEPDDPICIDPLVVNLLRWKKEVKGREEMMMDARPATEDDAVVSALYEASIQGCVSTLNRLVQKDPLILTKLSLTTISETPLHISASFGHVNFTRTLLLHKPKLASELNSLRRSPLHLASAEGHTETVQELLQAYGDACLVLDQDGRIPLHYAAMRGRADVIRELIRAKPESLKVLDRGETVLHLCIKYNQLKTLKVLVEFVGDKNEILNSRDCNTGNTILHLAVMLKQTENIKYLLSLPVIREAANAENQMGFTALEVLEHSPSDFRSFELRCLLIEACIKSKNNSFDDRPLLQKSANHVAVADRVRRPKEEKCWEKCLKSVDRWFKHEDDWLKETQGNLMVVATVISTMSYQAVIQPPEAITNGANSSMMFMIYNSISFVASLGVTLLLLSGLPLRNKFCVWLLSLTMFINLIVLALAFLVVATAVIPDSTSDNFNDVLGSLVIVLLLLMGLSLMFLTVRFFAWIGKKLYRRFRHKRSKACENMGTSLANLT